MAGVRERIEAKLTAALSPEALAVEDESHLHAGHAGHRPEGETHFRVYVTAAEFTGRSRLDRHRRVNAILAEELAGPVHALAVHATAPGEAGRR
jgi:BolA protein